MRHHVLAVAGLLLTVALLSLGQPVDALCRTLPVGVSLAGRNVTVWGQETM